MGTLTENIYFLILWLSIIAGFIFIYKNQLFSSYFFIPFFHLGFFGVEKYGEYLVNHGHLNYWLFNYATTAQICFYTWFASSTYLEKKMYKKTLWINLFFVLIAIVNIVFFQGKKHFHTITYGLGSLIIIAACIYYYYELFLYPNDKKLFKQADFWVVTAILFFYVCGFPLFVLNNIYFTKVAMSIWPIIAAISDCINILFYSLFIVAFLCKIKKY